MRKLIYLLSIVALVASCDKNEETKTNTTIEEKSLSMGAGYSNDIYYSLANGVISTPNRTEWDLGFFTDPRTSTIVINDGTIAGLYVWQGGDKSGWADVDASGIESQTSLYNSYSDTTWQNGAFDKGALGHPDYGWGVYNSSTHDINGDSIYIVVFADTTLQPKKLFIESRLAADNTYHFKYANLDGSDEQVAVIENATYLSKNMVHYSLTDNVVVDHEPAKADWDLLFTQYNDDVMNVPVTGVLVNEGVKVAKVQEADTATNNYADQTYSKVISSIGWNWKSWDGQAYSIKSNLVYFVETKDGKYYKIVFTGFDGKSTGNLKFVQTSY